MYASSFLVNLILLLIFSGEPWRVIAQSHGPYKSLDDLWSGELTNASQKMPPRNVALRGGQKFGQCCYLAVSQSLEIKNGSLAFREGQTMFRGNASTLETFQMPCDAVYNGSKADQPQIWVSYNWCSTNCPGWAISHSQELGEWVQPLLAFILPAVVFVLNVPRRRRIGVPKQLFPRLTGSLLDRFSLVFKVPVASLILLLDIVIWLAVVLCMAGPMLLSGIYEALLDFRLLYFLETRFSHNSLTVRQRAHLLLIILIGNLDQDPAWDHSISLIAQLPHDSLRRRHSSLSRPSTITRSDSGPYQANALDQITLVKRKLKSMLESQYSFGASVGAAVLFYTGSFIYTLAESRGEWGKGQHAHHIAFGIFWMVVPQIAIVGCLLLGGSNPSAWEGIGAQPASLLTRKISQGSTIHENGSHVSPSSPTRGSRENGRVLSPTTALPTMCSKIPSIPESEAFSFKERRTVWQEGRTVECFYRFYRPVYKTEYKPAWMWNRGMSKASWVRKIVEEYPKLDGLHDEVLHMGLVGWLMRVFAPAYILVLLPPFLGGLISFTTPVTGMSCRSLTTLVWAASQTLLMTLWLVDWKFFRQDKFRMAKSCVEREATSRLSWTHWLWYILFIPGVLASILTSIGGTMFVLMQLYRNCLCWLPVRYWKNRHTDPAAQMFLSDGNSLQIYYAKKYWIPVGLTAMGFLLALTYLGWWYSKRLRAQFHSLVRRLDSVNERDIKENEDLNEEHRRSAGGF